MVMICYVKLDSNQLSKDGFFFYFLDERNQKSYDPQLAQLFIGKYNQERHSSKAKNNPERMSKLQ